MATLACFLGNVTPHAITLHCVREREDKCLITICNESIFTKSLLALVKVVLCASHFNEIKTNVPQW
jgi:hypothetical protein